MTAVPVDDRGAEGGPPLVDGKVVDPDQIVTDGRVQTRTLVGRVLDLEVVPGLVEV